MAQTTRRPIRQPKMNSAKLFAISVALVLGAFSTNAASLSPRMRQNTSAKLRPSAALSHQPNASPAHGHSQRSWTSGSCTPMQSSLRWSLETVGQSSGRRNIAPRKAHLRDGTNPRLSEAGNHPQQPEPIGRITMGPRSRRWRPRFLGKDQFHRAAPASTTRRIAAAARISECPELITAKGTRRLRRLSSRA